MRFQDQTRWSDQELELQADETSRKFLAFFTEWFDAAEEKLKDKPNWTDLADPLRGSIAVVAVRHALADTEAKLEGFLGLEWIGQMLLLAEQHWVYGQELVRGLTIIERRAVELMAAVKLAELQASATL